MLNLPRYYAEALYDKPKEYEPETSWVVYKSSDINTLLNSHTALVEALKLAYHCLHGATQDSYYDAAKATIQKALKQAKGGA